MPSKFCTHYVRKSGRLSSGHRIEKGQSSSQFPRRVVPKNVLTIGQLLSSPTLVRSYLKSCVLGFSIMWTKNFQMSKLGLEKEELETNCQHSLDNRESKGISEKTSISVSSTMLKSLTVWIMTNCGKLLLVSWKTCVRVKKKQLDPCMEQLIGSRSRKEYDRAVYHHLICLIYTLSTSWEILGWMSY